MFNAIADGDPAGSVEQLAYYHLGVGGAVGTGISRHICSGYHWLGGNYEEGDEIYLFGFSRGAFPARSLGGFLGRGFLVRRNLEPRDAWIRVHKACEKDYRIKEATIQDWAEADWPFFHQRQAAPVRFIGAWDTVGALGVPVDLEILNIFTLMYKTNWQFHSAELGSNVTLDTIEGSFKKLTQNTSTDFLDTKRVEKLKRFTFIGAIANDAGSEKEVGNDGSPVPNQDVELAHESNPLKIASPGYLYCFPNDVRSLYCNNHGSLSLTVRRVF